MFADGLFKVPPQLPLEQAATLGCGFSTAAMGVWNDIGIARPSLTDTSSSGTKGKILVMGASGSVGAHAVHLAHLSGLHVFATASASNLDYVKSVGADEVFANDDPDLVKQLSGKGIDKVFYANYAGSAGEFLKASLDIISQIFGPKKGFVASTQGYFEKLPSNIEYLHIWVPYIFWVC
jgi:NADPH:quinone reductase-like Zn-dependent oxidoreductase